MDRYLGYLDWLSEDEPARKKQQFATMSKNWIIGTVGFAKEMMAEHQELASRGRQMATELSVAREAIWAAELDQLLRRIRRTPADLAAAGKSEEWKIKLAARLKARTTVTNRWLGVNLNLGARDEVCRKLTAHLRSRTAQPIHTPQSLTP